MNGSPDGRDLGGFTSAEAERKYTAAYADVLAQWPVPFTHLTVSTPFGETHVIVSGPEGGSPIVLLHATGMSSTVWLPNIGDLSQGHRTFAVDIVNEPGRTQQTRLLRNPFDCAIWLSGKRVLGMYLPGSEVDARFARQFELGVRGFRYANPRKSVFPRPYDDEQLRALSVQTLLLIGDQERTYAPRKALDRASRLVPAIDARLIAGAGHILAMQKPDTVDAEVVAFLSRPAGS